MNELRVRRLTQKVEKAVNFVYSAQDAKRSEAEQ